MKSRHRTTYPALPASPDGFPSASELATLRAWYQGMDTREAVDRYLGAHLAGGASARTIIRRIRDQLAAVAHARSRPDLAGLVSHREAERTKRMRAVFDAIETLRTSAPVTPHLSDPIERWLAPRSVEALHACGIRTLTDLTVRIPRRKMWWANIPGLGRTGAQQIEAFFARHSDLTNSARELVPVPAQHDVVPWELFMPPQDVDGSHGAFRAPKKTCTLNADNDYQAVQAWLSLHEAGSTLRAYRKEAERLILWRFWNGDARCLP